MMAWFQSINFSDRIELFSSIKSLPTPVGRLFFVLFILLGFSPTQVCSEAVPVTLKKTSTGWQLLRDNKPYIIRGAGGDAGLEKLASAGANSIRTWSTSDAGETLDRAYELGLTVTLGLWLGHERHGFDYHNKEQLEQQLEQVRQDVNQYKDHPALLLWGVGNEMEGFEDGDDPAIWSAVNAVAALVKELDPNHPTMSVTAEIGGGRVDRLHHDSPAIDIHGVNSYAGAMSLEKRLVESGAKKPFIITEFGPYGTWESPTTSWGAPLEPTSSEKANQYRASFEQAELNTSGLFLGSYAFTWGYKMEATETWFGMFLKGGWKLSAVDTMTELWSGAPPKNLAPRIEPLRINGSQEADPGDFVRVDTAITDPDQDQLSVRWVLRPESSDYHTGGDYRRNMPDIDGAVIQGDTKGARVQMPEAPGPYRLFAYAYDGVTSAATANIPLLVKGEILPPMPVDVYFEGLEGMPWAPSGWMGATDKLSVDGLHTDNPHAGSVALKIRYEGNYAWAGVAWQHPENNWGDANGGFDLTGASAIELWARGEYGGERVSFGVGLIGKDKPFPDSGMTKIDGIDLTREWQRYRLSLKGLNLSSIKTGFVVTLTGRQTPVTIYLDTIRFIK